MNLNLDSLRLRVRTGTATAADAAALLNEVDRLTAELAEQIKHAKNLTDWYARELQAARAGQNNTCGGGC